MYHLQDMGIGASVSRIWGRNSRDLYFVGRQGSVVHFDGTSWQKLESGTAVDFKDIWGITDEQRILAVASSVQETKIVSLANQSVISSISWPLALRSVWISPASVAYLSGTGAVWKQKDSSWQEIEGLPDTVFFAAIRGNGENDIFLNAGALAHYNGKSWHQYSEIPSEIRFYSLAVRGNTVAAVGFTLTGGFFVDKAAVVIGRR
jgi:hypothetical protein